MAGDFNAIISLDEKKGGLNKLDPSSTVFRDNISGLNLVDIMPSNGLFTWSNRRCGADCISEKLDRFLVSTFWIANTWDTSSKILDWRGSDHRPIKLSISQFG